MNGDQLMAKLLKKEGTEWISCFPAQTLIEACSQEGIRPILCRQERAGVNMADAYSRINNGNKIGVFTMQHGPGAENGFGGVAQAYADNVPMLLIPGGSTERRVGVHPGFDAIPNYQHITKRVCCQITHPQKRERNGRKQSKNKPKRPKYIDTLSSKKKTPKNLLFQVRQFFHRV